MLDTSIILGQRGGAWKRMAVAGSADYGQFRKRATRNQKKRLKATAESQKIESWQPQHHANDRVGAIQSRPTASNGNESRQPNLPNTPANGRHLAAMAGVSLPVLKTYKNSKRNS